MIRVVFAKLVYRFTGFFLRKRVDANYDEECFSEYLKQPIISRLSELEKYEAVCRIVKNRKGRYAR